MLQFSVRFYRRMMVATTAALVLSGSIYLLARNAEPAVSPVVADSEEVMVPAVMMETAEAPLKLAMAAEISPEQPGEQLTIALQRPKIQEYVVAEGDTISGIATQFTLQMETLLWANDVGEDDVLSIGQVLLIPSADGVLRQINEGDTLWDLALQHAVEVEEIVKANPEVEPSSLQSGEYLLIPGGKPATRRQIASARSGGRSGIWQFDYWPTTGPLTDPFGWRIHPVYGTRTFHDGMDIGVGSGTPLRVVASGRVTLAARYGGYGLAIKVDHGGGVVTQYSHMSQIDVAEGDRLQAGQHLGYSGNTGVSTGPHLHFSVFQDGAPVDPMPWLP